MRRFRLVNMLLPLLALCSCTDDWKFSTDSGYVLGFSADIVCFDTVFTGAASASAEFRIYNPNDVGLRFDALMGGGAASAFRMNLDGEGGATIAGLEIPAGDSLFCFVSVNITQTDQTEVFSAFDSIRFVLESGEVQCVRLLARGQNAVRLKGRRIEADETLPSRLPYIVYDSFLPVQGSISIRMRYLTWPAV